jgi:acetylglutamate kinase
MNKLFVVKVGGNVLDDEKNRKQFLKDFASITEPKILVHGGGAVATKIGDQLGIRSTYHHGRRITDEPARDLVTMVYGGLINRQLVAQLQACGCNALGLTGADGNLLNAVKRPVKEVDYGYVGDLTHEGVNTVLLTSLLQQNITPVIAPLTHAGGDVLNTNADTIAAVLAVALSTVFDVRLIFCFEKKGVLREVNDEHSVIPQLTQSSFADLLKAGALAGGILPKLENAFAAIQAGVKEVLIGEADDLLKNTGTRTEGTLIH